MRLRHRILLTFWLYVWAVIFLFFTDWILVFILPVLGLFYVIFGGKAHD
ncbi:MAG: hypothetical protein K9K93_06670 [Acholeplasmataceae bacterium]|nr:hypothetical protein [Acholeplasmataceae bacterium]